MKAIAIGWQGALLGNMLVVALFLYRNSPFVWGILGVLAAIQGLLTVWVLVRERNLADNESADAAIQNQTREAAASAFTSTGQSAAGEFLIQR